MQRETPVSSSLEMAIFVTLPFEKPLSTMKRGNPKIGHSSLGSRNFCCKIVTFDGENFDLITYGKKAHFLAVYYFLDIVC